MDNRDDNLDKGLLTNRIDLESPNFSQQQMQLQTKNDEDTCEKNVQLAKLHEWEN